MKNRIKMMYRFLVFSSLLTTMRCVRRQACWANTKHRGRPPVDGQDRGTILAGKMTPTKYKYQKCKYYNLLCISSFLFYFVFE